MHVVVAHTVERSGVASRRTGARRQSHFNSISSKARRVSMDSVGAAREASAQR
jgi:hypothetical protein